VTDSVILIDRYNTGSLADVEVIGPIGDYEDIDAWVSSLRADNPQAVVEIATVRR
jgi:hypothetical protein